MRAKLLLISLIGIDFILLLLQIRGLSIGYNEAGVIYGEPSVLKSFIDFSFTLFGRNDYTLRLPMIVLHTISVVLLYAISRYYVSRDSDRLWIVLIYMLLPGVVSSALVVDAAGLIITLLFLFVYIYLRFEKYALLLLPLLIWIDASFAYLFLAVVLFGLYRKDWYWLSAGGLALAISIYQYGINIGGVPESRFLDILGVYAAIFSPIVFIYLFYVLYRRLIAKEWDLIWTIGITSLLISMLLSFRQKVPVQLFAPFLLITLPLAAQTFYRTYRVRLREFRGRYRILFYTSFFLLIINALAVFFNQWFYRFLDDPTRHFSYPMHVAKELAQTLKDEGIRCAHTDDKKLQLRLRFYGITQCKSTDLSTAYNAKGKKVTISYKNKPVYIVYVTKVNK